MSGCRGKETMGFNDRDKLNLKMADKIIECINNKDEEGLYNLFSDEVKNTDLTLKDEIIYLYNNIGGRIDSYEKWAIGSSTSIEKEKNSTSYQSKFKIEINGISYYMYYDNTVKNDFLLENIGLKFIKIFAEVDEEKHFCYWNEIPKGVSFPY